jgi:hypothetical protein
MDQEHWTEKNNNVKSRELTSDEHLCLWGEEAGLGGLVHSEHHAVLGTEIEQRSLLTTIE